MFYLEGLLNEGDKYFIKTSRSLEWYGFINAYSAYLPILMMRYMKGLME